MNVYCCELPDSEDVAIDAAKSDCPPRVPVIRAELEKSIVLDPAFVSVSPAPIVGVVVVALELHNIATK